MSYCKFKDRESEEYDLLGPPHPGEIAHENALLRLGLSRKELAATLDVSTSTVSKVLHGRRRVSPKIAAGLAKLTGTTPLYWLVMQAHYDAWLLSKPVESPSRKSKRSSAYSQAPRARRSTALAPA